MNDTLLYILVWILFLLFVIAVVVADSSYRKHKVECLSEPKHKYYNQRCEIYNSVVSIPELDWSAIEIYGIKEVKWDTDTKLKFLNGDIYVFGIIPSENIAFIKE